MLVEVLLLLDKAYWEDARTSLDEPFAGNGYSAVGEGGGVIG